MAFAMIDLHLHTTASDGALAPAALVQRAASAGITFLSVTDHDTTAGLAEASEAAARLGVGFIPGIEITAVWAKRDVHVLAYFIERLDGDLADLITAAAADRLQRAREMANRLAAMNAPINIDALIAANGGRSIARPVVARALVAHGHAASINDAFERFLADGRPAYVPRRGATPAVVIDAIVRCGGLAVLAHPGALRDPLPIDDLVDAGLGGIEVYHSAHDKATTAQFLDLARSHDLVVTGGSDFHGDDVRYADCLGRVVLPEQEFAGLMSRGHVSRVYAQEVR
jgi:predicted metal-dependent phosphoesterase TrpH